MTNSENYRAAGDQTPAVFFSSEASCRSHAQGARAVGRTATGKAGGDASTVGARELEELAALGCTVDELAGWFGQPLGRFRKSLKDPSLAAAYDRGKVGGRIHLRWLQRRLAEKNATMAIFLGRCELGQDTDGIGDAPMTIIVNTGISRATRRTR